ncbi:MAG: RNA-binding S4 domain-containing protein [Granulosicoccus sp.]
MSEGQDTQTVILDSQPVELYKILKFEGLVASGAQAKLVIDDGLVSVNGDVETRRRRKIFHGDQVEFEGLRLSMVLVDATPK